MAIKAAGFQLVGLATGRLPSDLMNAQPSDQISDEDKRQANAPSRKSRPVEKIPIGDAEIKRTTEDNDGHQPDTRFVRCRWSARWPYSSFRIGDRPKHRGKHVCRDSQAYGEHGNHGVANVRGSDVIVMPGSASDLIGNRVASSVPAYAADAAIIEVLDPGFVCLRTECHKALVWKKFSLNQIKLLKHSICLHHEGLGLEFCSSILPLRWPGMAVAKSSKGKPCHEFGCL